MVPTRRWQGERIGSMIVGVESSRSTTEPELSDVHAPVRDLRLRSIGLGTAVLFYALAGVWAARALLSYAEDPSDPDIGWRLLLAGVWALAGVRAWRQLVTATVDGRLLIRSLLRTRTIPRSTIDGFRTREGSWLSGHPVEVLFRDSDGLVLPAASSAAKAAEQQRQLQAWLRPTP